jgi:hypothetical protein
MQLQTTNHNIDLTTWLGFTRNDLKAIAKKQGIGIPDNKQDLAVNLQRGYSASQNQEDARTFKVRLSV